MNSTEEMSPRLTDLFEIRDFCMWIDNYNVPEAFQSSTVEQCQEWLNFAFSKEETGHDKGQEDYRGCLQTYWKRGKGGHRP